MKQYIIFILLIFSVGFAFGQIKVEKKLAAKKHQIVCVDYSPNGKYLAAGGMDSKIVLFDIASGKTIKEFDELKDFPVDLSFSPDGKYIISSGKDKKVTVWDIATGDKRQLKGHKKTVRSVSISPDGNKIASGSDDETIIIWDFATGDIILTFPAHEKGVNAVDFNPAGTKLLSGGVDNHLKVWDVNSGEKVMDIEAHRDRIRDAAFSPDGTIMASAGDDKAVNFWSADNGELLNSIRVHKKWVQTIAFSPDGQYLLSGGHDNMLLLTHINQGKIIYKSDKLENYILTVGFHPLGKSFASACLFDEVVEIWDASGLNIKQPEKIIADNGSPEKKPKPVKKPEIEWTAPTSDMVFYNEAVQINACVNSLAPLTRVSLLQNGEVIYSFDRKEIMMNKGDCTFTLKKNIFLKKGENHLIVKAKNIGEENSTQQLTLTLKDKPVTVDIQWEGAKDSIVEQKNYLVKCCIESSIPVTSLEIHNNDTLLANITSLITKTSLCSQYVNYPVELYKGKNNLVIKAHAKNKIVKREKNILFEEPVIADIPPTNTEPINTTEENQPIQQKEDTQEIATVRNPVELNPYKFALIIGNEDYSSYQVGLKSEVNVDYAHNDATAFKEHAQKYLGIPEENIIFLLDARYIQMRRALKKMSGIIEMTSGKAEVFFYYAGHGFPHEKTKEPYFVPVDGSGADLEFSAIKQKDVYDELTQHPSKRLTVFVDACFSGGARNQGLLSARGVKIKPRETTAQGKMIVFTASSEDQSSLPYKEKEHGMFTWFLLEKIEETNGYVNYHTLSDYLKEQVGIKSYMINSKRQVPQTNVSPNIIDQWEKWKLNE